jgi:phenylacetate-CoA ligase
MDKKSPLGKNKWQYSAKMSRYTNCFSKLILYFATLSNSNTDTTNNYIPKSMIWNESIECMDRENLRKLQSMRLKKIVEHVYYNTPFYRKKMQEMGITPDDIHDIDDLVKLPFTTKTDLRDNYPFGLCAVPMSQIVRIHGSSGTTGKPTVVGYTRKDLAAWTECLSRSFSAYGAGNTDIFHIAYGYGLFTGGLGAHYGAENIGASVIPMSSGNTEKQITLMHDFGSTVLCCTPSYALFIADTIKDSGVPREDFKLKVGVFGAEPWTESMRKEIEEKLCIKAYDIYGLSEIAGPGVGYECECQNGTHLNEDHFFPEIVDPKTLQPVNPGETGELVFTHLTKEGMPLLRYRTKDLTALHYEKCACGRTLVRMDRILGRSDDMLIIRGVNVFPTQIESVILEMPEFEPHYLLIVDRVNNTDTMELKVEARPDFYSDEINKMLALKKKLTARLQSVLGLGVNVKIVEPRSIERSVGKAKRVIDNRKL